MTEAQWKHIVGAGAIGGFLSWIYSVTIGQTPALGALLAVPAFILLGAGAGYIGVYVIANSDTKVFHRCLGFALLCGFSWKPVYDAGGALVTQSAQHAQESRIDAQISELQDQSNKLNTTPDPDLPMAMNATVSRIEQLLPLRGSLQNQDIWKKAQHEIRNATTSIRNATPRAPDTGVTSLKKVAIAALNAQEIDISKESIDLLADYGKDQNDMKSSSLVYPSLQEIRKVALTNDKTDLAIFSQQRAAEVLLTAATVAKERGDLKTLQALPLKDAQTDLATTLDFYRLTNNDQQVQNVLNQSQMLNTLAASID